MLLVQAHQLVARLPVYRTLVGLVAVSDSVIGVAVSDPYLSFAKPLPSVTDLAAVPKLAAELKAGAVVVGLPFAAAGLQQAASLQPRAHQHVVARQQRVLAALLREPAVGDAQLMVCAYAAPAQLHTADSVAQSFRDNLLWDQTAVDELGKHGESRDAAIEAAVSLQLFLDEYSGGWANTFG